ncbi:hypothetical protein M8C21_011138 [Ambrosia artemisiifolia]|uniref:Inactive purple acid phosphatase-like protein n=1 Tax=Ambrosia artemisiifolia TaxID=4212 RepID=A0AAD5CZB6_AMBAR|nr:hypothetical protein M8C21_011138 [Ambrosia artemisiifolia]
MLSRRGDFRFICCCSDKAVSNRRIGEEWQGDVRRNGCKVRVQASPTWRFASSQPQQASRQEKYFPRCTPSNPGPQSRDTPPKRDNLIWYRQNDDVSRTFDCIDFFFCCGTNVWWEKSDWTGYKELGVEKSGKNSEGESWWETWREVLHQDEWSNIAKIERSAQKQAKSGTEDAGWYENWWEKYDAKGWTEKGAHKYGRLNEQSWWEKWGEHYDGRGSVLKWTDKWAETELGTKWGDKWEEKFFGGVGSRQGETWHVTPAGERWSRTWGEEHFGNGKVHKYGKSTTSESWDIVVDEETSYEAEPHYGWADVVGDSSQLLSIQPQDKPPGVYFLDFGSSPPPPQGASPSSMPPQDDNPPSTPPQDGDPPSTPPITQ